MDESQLAALYQQYLGRAPDPSGIATWSGQDPSAVIAGITGSQEYQNDQAAQSSGSGGGGGDSSSQAAAPAATPNLSTMDPSAAVAQIYQNVLGRAPDAAAAGWINAIQNGADPQQIAQQIASSQEGQAYASSNPSAQFSGLASLSQANNPLAGTTSAYNNMQYVGGGTDPSSGDRTYQYKDSNGGTVAVDSSGNPVGYTPGQSWYQQQYQAHPDAIRSGYRNEQYLALGPLAQTQNINGVNVPITNAYEYQIDPKTKALTTNPVDRAPENQGFTDFLTTPAGALTAMAALGTGGLGLNALAGEAALGGGAVGMGGGTGLTGGVGGSTGILGGGTVGSIVAPSTGGALGLDATAEAAIAAGGGADLASTASSFSPAGTGGLNAALPAAGSVGGAGAMSAALPAGTMIGDGTAGTIMGASYMAAAPGQFAVDALGNAIPASSVGIDGFAPSTSFSDLLPSASSLTGPLSKIATSAIPAIAKVLTGGTTSGTTAANQSGLNTTGSNSGISNLTPGLTKGSQFKFANEPVFADTQTQMPAQAQPDYTQQILNAAQGGLVNHYAEGGDVPEAPSPFLKPELFRGRRLAPIGRFNSTQMPGYQPRQFADGGEVEGHNPQFFSEGGLNSLENTYVKGEGDGTSDSVPAMLANGEFVVPADVVSKLGNGSNDAGANVLDQFLATIREHAQKHDPKELPPDSKGPLAYLLDAKRKA